MKLKCIIVDDDLHSINGLKAYLDAFPKLELLKVYTDPVEALHEISHLQELDVIFMDVDMPLISGIELSKAIRHKAKKLIFTTSHTKYAYEAFELNADAYLLKPYSFARFAETLNRLFPIKELASATDKILEDYFYVRDKNDENNLVKIHYQDLIAIESLQNYIRIIRPNDFVIAYISLSEIREILSNHPDFIQVHRSFIIAKSAITKLEGYLIILSNGLEINIGKIYRTEVQEYLKTKTLKTNRT